MWTTLTRGPGLSSKSHIHPAHLAQLSLDRRETRIEVMSLVLVFRKVSLDPEAQRDLHALPPEGIEKGTDCSSVCSYITVCLSLIKQAVLQHTPASGDAGINSPRDWAVEPVEVSPYREVLARAR